MFDIRAACAWGMFQAYGKNISLVNDPHLPRSWIFHSGALLFTTPLCGHLAGNGFRSWTIRAIRDSNRRLLQELHEYRRRNLDVRLPCRAALHNFAAVEEIALLVR